MEFNGGFIVKHEHLNYIILHDGSFYRIMERLGKDVPFSAYNPNRHLGIGTSVDEALRNSSVPIYQIEHHPIEVMFND